MIARLMTDSAGYYAAIVEPAYDWDDGARTPEADEVLEVGPASDAMLICLPRGISSDLSRILG